MIDSNGDRYAATDSIAPLGYVFETIVDGLWTLNKQNRQTRSYSHLEPKLRPSPTAGSIFQHRRMRRWSESTLSDEFDALAYNIYTSLGSPKLDALSGWGIFNAMVPLIRQEIGTMVA